MNRKDIAARVAGEAGIARQDAEAAVCAVFASIAETLAPRQGRHPRTGKSISIGPSSGVSFRAGSECGVTVRVPGG